MDRLIFPIKAEDFVTYQAELLQKYHGRNLTDEEKELAVYAAEVINTAYHDGTVGAETELYPRDPEAAGAELFARMLQEGAAASAEHFILDFVRLCNEAWLQGIKDAKGGVA